jgi:hypothetical protein
MDPNVIFYLASTVAQALASLVGFLGAFVLFQVQGQAAALKAAGEMVCDGILDQPQLLHMVAAANYDEFVARVQALILEDPARLRQEPEYFAGMLDHFRRQLDKHNAAVGPFKLALKWTAPVLVASLAIVVAAPQVCAMRDLAYASSASLIAGFAWCGWLYWRVVQASLERD